MDAVGGMQPDTLQDVDQIIIGIDLVESAGYDQALHDPDVFGPEFGPAEHPVLAPHRNRPQRPFQRVGIDRDVWIGQIDLQPESPLAGVGQRLGHGIAR